MATSSFGPTSLAIDAAAATDRIVEGLRGNLADDFRRKGYVVGLSGGVDIVAATPERTGLTLFVSGDLLHRCVFATYPCLNAR